MAFLRMENALILEKKPFLQENATLICTLHKKVVLLYAFSG